MRAGRGTGIYTFQPLSNLPDPFQPLPNLPDPFQPLPILLDKKENIENSRKILQCAKISKYLQIL